MKYSYSPSKLIKAKEIVFLEHTGEGPRWEFEEDEELLKLIGHIANLSSDKLGSYVTALTKKDMKKVAAYIPHNFYNVDLTNLFKAFIQRENDELDRIIFDQWQEAFESKACNMFLSGLVDNSKGFRTILNDHSVSAGFYKEILEAVYIPMFLGPRIAQNGHISALKKDEEFWGIRTNSRLYKEICDVFYTFCNESDYLDESDDSLCAIARKYINVRSHNLQKPLLINLLEKLSVGELEKLPKLAQFYLQITGERNTEKFNGYFQDVSEGLIQKYVSWTNIITLNEVFGYDERSNFWKRYNYISVKRYKASQSVLMETEEYYISEFLGTGMGPYYFYKKEFFEDRKLRRLFLNSSNQALRSEIYSLWGKSYYKDIHLFRDTHQGYWQDRARQFIAVKKITNRNQLS